MDAGRVVWWCGLGIGDGLCREMDGNRVEWQIINPARLWERLRQHAQRPPPSLTDCTERVGRGVCSDKGKGWTARGVHWGVCVTFTRVPPSTQKPPSFRSVACVGSSVRKSSGLTRRHRLCADKSKQSLTSIVSNANATLLQATHEARRRASPPCRRPHRNSQLASSLARGMPQ